MQSGIVGVARTESAWRFFRDWYWDPPNNIYWSPPGVSMLLEQEGIPFRTISDRDLEDENALKQFSVLVLADQPFLTEKQKETVHAVHRRGTGIIADGMTGWIDPGKSDSRRMEMGLRSLPQLADLQGLTKVGYDLFYGTHHLKVTQREHMITHMLENPEEQSFPIKYLPRMEVKGLAPKTSVLAKFLSSKKRTGSPALMAYDDGFGRVVTFAFPAARWAIFKGNGPLHPEKDLDIVNYPMDCAVDSLRMMMAGAVHWASPKQVLVKKYYWRAEGGVIPKAIVSTNTDLCGGTETGIRAVKEMCTPFGFRHTFMDTPWRRDMNRENVEDHDVALHEFDSTGLETLKEGRKKLQEATGREVKGWARHGATKLVNYPHVWQKAADAGFQWTRHMYVQTPLEAAEAPYLRELEAPSNRLPYRPYNPFYGRFEDVLEIPIFDTTDDLDRLLIEYGHQYTWNEWLKVVEKRLKIHGGNHVICSYQVHGWVAGAAAGEPQEEKGWRAIPSWRDAAKDCLKMLKIFLKYAQANGLPVKTGTEINDWWRARTYGVEILNTNFSKEELTVEVANKTQEAIDGFTLQVCLPKGAKVKNASIGNQSISGLKVWTENKHDKAMIPLNLKPGKSIVKITIEPS